VDPKYSLILVGTGFASTFFLREALRHAKPGDRILVLERGDDLPYDWKVANRRNSPVRFDDLFHNRTPNKPWIQNIAFGGGSCWTGNSPRLHPSDFRTASLYGVGVDWPIDYAELEPYLCEAEEAMGIAGAANPNYPRSRPYGSPAHALNAFDRLMQARHGDLYTAMPSARASQAQAGRPSCCNNGVCSVCPIGAKFQIDLHMREPYQDPRVSLLTGAEVLQVDIEGERARGVLYRRDGREQRASGDIVAMGAHAVMTPYLLLRSGLTDAALGRYLNEQRNIAVRINLRGVKNFGGGQRVTGLGLMFLNNADRGQVPGCLIEGYNVPWLRAETGRWREVAHVQFALEDTTSADNRVTVGADGRPEVTYVGQSDYLLRGLAAIEARLETMLEGLPVEDYLIESDVDAPGGAAHIQGTTRMGRDPATSVVDDGLVHHRVRNLLALGSGVFPTCPAANPTLPLSALSIRAARKLWS
jgi:choline dehydrogenase-like flavoprotein